MSKLSTILFCCFLYCPHLLIAQIVFQKTFGGTENDRGYAVVATSDGGYFLAGTTASFGNGSYEMYLVKTDNNGDTLWTKVIGGANTDWIYDVQETDDDAIILTGWTDIGNSNRVPFLVKLDSFGSLLWTKTYGRTAMFLDYSFAVQQTSDDGFIITGFTDDSNLPGGGIAIYLVKTNAFGDTLWTKVYNNGNSGDYGYDVKQTKDGGFIITGFTSSSGAGLQDVFLIKTNSVGDISWSKTYGGGSYDRGNRVIQTEDDGYLVMASTESFSTDSTDLALIKTDSSGSVIWAKSYGGVGADSGYEQFGQGEIRQTDDGGFVILTRSTSFGNDTNDVYLVKVSNSGTLLWSRIYGGTDNDYGEAIDVAFDGGLIICGWTESFGTGNSDMYLIKTDSYGNAGCNSFQIVTNETENLPIQEAVFNVTINSGALQSLPNFLFSSTNTEVIDVCAQICTGLNSSIDSVSKLCIGDSTGGSAQVTASGGLPPYSIIWSNGSTDSFVTNLFAGQFSVTITDANNCQKVVLDTIVFIEDVNVAYSITPSNFGQNNGAVKVMVVSGGIPPFEYSLDGVSYQSSDSFTGLGAGGYALSIQDSNGCVYIDSVYIDEVNSIGIVQNEKAISVFPNPASAEIVIQNKETSFLESEIQLYDVNFHKIVITFEATQNEIRADIKELAKGIYFLEITSPNLFIRRKVILQ